MLKVLNPITVDDTRFVSSSVPETEFAAWSAATTYTAAAKAIYKHRIWESLQGTNLNKVPDAATSAAWWLDTGPTNRWAMFDGQTSTATTATGSLNSTVAPGIAVNGAALIGVTGISSAKVEMFNGPTLVFTQTKTVDNTFISNWYEYFFEPYDVQTELVFGPMPPYASATVKMTLTGSTGGTTVGCAAFSVGNVVEIGTVQAGAGAGIVDYSRKETDAFGTTTLVRRAFAKRSNYQMIVDNAQLRRVFSTLAELRATPAVWIGSDDYRLSPLVVYGFYKDFSISVAYPTFSTCSLEIEGLS